jgi:hypothetical protein
VSETNGGYRVIGITLMGDLHAWYFPTLEDADNFAKSLAANTGREVTVCTALGMWAPRESPVLWRPAPE